MHIIQNLEASRFGAPLTVDKLHLHVDSYELGNRVPAALHPRWNVHLACEQDTDRRRIGEKVDTSFRLRVTFHGTDGQIRGFAIQDPLPFEAAPEHAVSSGCLFLAATTLNAEYVLEHAMAQAVAHAGHLTICIQPEQTLFTATLHLPKWRSSGKMPYPLGGLNALFVLCDNVHEHVSR